MTIITVNASCPKNDTRERVIRQMLWWVTVKGQGGVNGRAGGADANARFVMYREVVLSVDYASNRLQLTAKIEKKFNLQGVSGMPFSLADTGFIATNDYGKVDEYGAPYLAPGEAKQGTERAAALSPKLNYAGTAGSYLADILVDRIKLSNPQSKRDLPDGSLYVCGNGSANTPQPTEARSFYDGPDTELYVEVVITELLNLLDIAMSWIQDGDQNYESTWMQTKYKTDKGTMVLPTGGVMPGGTTDPDLIRKRVQFTLHEGLTKKVVHWGVQSVAPTAPSYPSSAPVDANQILVDEKVQPAACNPVGPGMFAWTITGTYIYELLNLKGSGDTLGIGLLPISPGNVADYNLAGGKARSGYIPP